MRAAAVLAAALVLAFPSSSGSGDTSARPPAEAHAEPDGMLVLAVLSPERAMVADPRTGATSARELPGGTLCHGPLLAAGDRVVFSGLRGRRLEALSSPIGRPGRARALGRADTFTASSSAGRVWLGRWSRLGGRTARISLREVDGAGRVLARTSWLLPRWGTLEGVVDGGLLVSRGRGLVLRRPRQPALHFGGGWPLAVAGDRFAWCPRGCRNVSLWSHGGGERTFDAPPQLRPEAGPRGAFSPDGRRLALPVRTRSGSRVAVIDLDRGAWRLVPGGRIAGYEAIAWSPSGRWLYFSRGRRVLAARDGIGRAVRLPIRTGGAVMSIASGSTSTPGSAGR